MLRKTELCRLAAQIVNGRNMSIADMGNAYDALCKAASISLKEGESIQFNGLVKLIPRVQEEHEARNPATGGTVTVPSKVVVKATVMPSLKKEMAEVNVKKFRKAVDKKK